MNFFYLAGSENATSVSSSKSGYECHFDQFDCHAWIGNKGSNVSFWDFSGNMNYGCLKLYCMLPINMVKSLTFKVILCFPLIPLKNLFFKKFPL